MMRTIKQGDTLLVSVLMAIGLFVLYTFLPFPYGLLALCVGGVIILNFKHIETALALFIIAIPFLPNTFMILLSMWIVFLYVRYCIKKEELDIEVKTKALPLIALWGVMFLTTVLSTDVKGSVRDLALHTLALLVVIVFLQSIKEKRQLYGLISILCYTSSLVAFYGLYQYFVGVELDPAWVDTTVNPDLTTRVFSVFGNPNILAEYLIMITPICFAFLIGDKNWFRKVIFGGIFILNSIVILLTLSRGGWVGFAFGMFIFFLMIDRRFIWAIVPVGIIALFILPKSIVNRILTIFNTSDSSNNYRIVVWKNTLKMIKDNFFNGVGLGYLPFKSSYLHYIRTMNVYHAHNLYLEIFAEMGIGGIILFVVSIGTFLKDGFISIKNKTDKMLKFLVMGVIAGILAILMHGMFENILYIPRIIFSFWVMIALLIKSSELLSAEA